VTELQRLEPGATQIVRAYVEGLDLRSGPPAAGGRPRVVACMIGSADGRASVAGRSVALGHPADRALLRELRAAVDALLVGSRTLVAERYANLLDADHRELRVAAGLAEHPLVATISRSGQLPDAPVVREPGVTVEVFRDAPAAVLDELGRRGARAVLCEGGPALLREVIAAGCLDDLFLTVAPLLVAGAGPTILGGEALPEPARLPLREVQRAGDHVFLHYGRAL
jgi:riboflavin biosynthesis pyrimidine reductase